MTVEEMKQIRDIIREELDPMKEDMKGLKEDVEDLKVDVKGLKSDVETLKADVEELKEDMDDAIGKINMISEWCEAASKFHIREIHYPLDPEEKLG